MRDDDTPDDADAGDDSSQASATGGSRATRASQAAVSEEPTFELSRLRGRDGPAIVASSFGDGEVPDGATSVGVIAGAFFGEDDDLAVTRTQIAERVRGFLAHTDDTDRDDPPATGEEE